MSPTTRSSSRLGARSRRPRHATAAAAAVVIVIAALALSTVVGAAAAADEDLSTSLDICLEGSSNDARPPLLMLEWADDAALAVAAASPGCACELLPADGGGEGVGEGNENDDNDNDNYNERDSRPTAIRPGDSARVFRLLRPSARLACSAQCGRVRLSAADGGQEWVLPPEGAALRLPRGGGGAGASCGGAALSSGFGCGGEGGDGATPLLLLHALTLRADISAAIKPAQPSVLPRAGALLLFVGLNAAAARLSLSLTPAAATR